MGRCETNASMGEAMISITNILHHRLRRTGYLLFVFTLPPIIMAKLPIILSFLFVLGSFSTEPWVMGGKGTLSTSFLGNSRGNPRRQGFQPGEVRLRSLASAVRFYERIGYERLEV